MFDRFKIEISMAAKEAAPKEMCGVVHAGKFIQLENIHSEPENHFAFSDADTLRYMTDPATEAIVHSHPGEVTEAGLVSRLSPSAADMRQQLATSKPWIIAAFNVTTGAWEYFDWGKHTLDLPLLERPFRHGVEDCYTVIEKWWWQNRGVRLLPMPRDDSWWGKKGKVAPVANLYVDHFRDCGAERFWPRSPGDLRPGDVCLTKIDSEHYNHGGVFIGHGRIAHHPPTKLSTTWPAGPWFNRIDFWLRREEGK